MAIRNRCRNCKEYRPSFKYKDNNYCRIGLCKKAKENKSLIGVNNYGYEKVYEERKSCGEHALGLC